jgi:hypothetical protein
MVLGLAGWMMPGLDEDAASRELQALCATLAAHTTDTGLRYDSAGWLNSVELQDPGVRCARVAL